MTARVVVVGATGYSGGELVALLHRHPQVELAATFGGITRAPFEALHPSLRGTVGPDAQPFSVDALHSARPDVVLLATPNEVSAEIVPQLGALRIVDLSGAFRLDAAEHARWYGFPRPELDALYSVPELLEDTAGIRAARLVANPGCYATSVILALAPLHGLVRDEAIIADCKSGVSGAGKRSELAYAFTELDGNCKAYATSGHRHAPEIRRAAKVTQELVFVPHLLPTVRGILSTIYVPLVPGTTLESIERRYARYDCLVRARRDVLPALADVVRTPRCEIGFHLVAPDRLLVVSALDNLLKGAASQAVQNLNLMLGIPELTGLVGAGSEAETERKSQ